MKKVFRWLLWICGVLIILLVVAILSLDHVIKSFAEKQIRQETGMEVHIGEFHLGLLQHSVTIKDFKLNNLPEFGGATFIDLPELHVEIDWDAAQSNHIHLRLLRINLAQLNIIENKEGKRNYEFYKMKKLPGQSGGITVHRTKPDYKFAGIDEIHITVGETKFTSDLHPERNFDRQTVLQDQVYKDIKTEDDLKAVGIVLGLKTGLDVLIQNMFVK